MHAPICSVYLLYQGASPESNTQARILRRCTQGKEKRQVSPKGALFCPVTALPLPVSGLSGPSNVPCCDHSFKSITSSSYYHRWNNTKRWATLTHHHLQNLFIINRSTVTLAFGLRLYKTTSLGARI